MATGGRIPMTETADLLALAQWLSPAYPVGAFAWSHGLEAAIEGGAVADADALADWLDGLLRHGAGWSDAVILSAAHRGDAPDGELAALAAALAPSRERRAETVEQGGAFARTTAALAGHPSWPAPYPVAVGRAARALALPTAQVAALYLQAFAGNLVSAAVRFVPLGATEGQVVLARLRPVILEAAERAARTAPEDISLSQPGADLASLAHETQTVRIFRS